MTSVAFVPAMTRRLWQRLRRSKIVGVLREAFPETSGLVLHVEAAVAESVAKNVGEQFHDRDTLDLCDGANPEKLANTEGYEEELN